MRLAVIFVGVAAVAGVPATAAAHVVYGSPRLWQLVRDADVVVDARIGDPAEIVTQASPPLRRRVVTATPLAGLKGALPPGEVRFAPHGHGVAEYARHERVLLFLKRIAKAIRTSPATGHGRYLAVAASFVCRRAFLLSRVTIRRACLSTSSRKRRSRE
jgi:hypothetical protein